MGRDDLGAFKYHVREVVDAFGNRAVYSYLPADEQSSGSTRLISKIEYAFDRQGQNPRYVIQMTYEDRADVMSDCKAGYCELMGKRLKTISVLSAALRFANTCLNMMSYKHRQICRDLSVSSVMGCRMLCFLVSMSLISAITRYGLHEWHVEPYFIDISNSVGANLRAGSATLIDMNGDALPDVVNTQNEEHHSTSTSLLLMGLRDLLPLAQRSTTGV